MSRAWLSIDRVTEFSASWTADGSHFVIVACEGEGPEQDRASMLLDDEQIELLRAALHKPRRDRQGITEADEFTRPSPTEHGPGVTAHR